MVTVIAAIVGLLALGSTLYFTMSRQAKIDLAMPASYRIGELIVLDATKSPGILQWKILPETKNFEIVGKKAYFSSSSATRYTVFISGTIGGTLATEVFFLEPATQEEPEPKPEPKPEFLKISKMISSGIVTTLDGAMAATKQLGLDVPDFKTLEEYTLWLTR
jgi:hypothetical protein